ncbi:MAG: hypothetical protein WDN76_04645 [Alphaproteobacteria bacterium]
MAEAAEIAPSTITRFESGKADFRCARSTSFSVCLSAAALSSSTLTATGEWASG